MNPKTITATNFRRYGKVIEYPQKHLKGNKRNLWRIVMRDPTARGWRIAYLIVRDRKLNRLERHPYSFESFEPIVGKSLLYVSTKQDERLIECFNLDKPIILKKNIWHGIVTVTKESELKLTENAKVNCVYWPLTRKLSYNESL